MNTTFKRWSRPELPPINNLQNIDVIFISAYDHNDGTPNHGLFQMFEFFKQNISRKSIYLSTLQGVRTNKEDCFDISSLGQFIPLAGQVNKAFMSVTNRSPVDSPKMWINRFNNDREAYTNYAAKVLIDNLPPHKFIAISDKEDIDLFVLEKVLRHFKSKVIILSAVHNTWTSHCSYPDEFNCDKYKTEKGCCAPCPSLMSLPKRDGGGQADNDFLFQTFKDTKTFVERNKDSVLLNVGSKYSIEEANKSYIFKDVEKSLITLKTIYTPENFESLWKTKKDCRKDFFDKLKEHNFRHSAITSIDDIKFIMMWSASEASLKRKGFDHFFTSIEILKHFLKFNRFGEVIILMSCKISDKQILQKIKKSEIPLVHSGHVKRETYNHLLMASDVYCSTTISDAGPRTIVESAAAATPVVSFDRCVAADIINDKNGALVPIYDVKKFAKEIYRFINLTEEEKKQYSENLFNDYNTLMNNELLAKKWEDFLQKNEV